jgi:hypothetical protein
LARLTPILFRGKIKFYFLILVFLPSGAALAAALSSFSGEHVIDPSEQSSVL